jgi:hypothetical protein
VGGATIIERIYLRKGLKFVFTPNGWFYWNGIIWVADEGGSHILRIMREELVKVEKGYLAERGSNLEARSDEASMESDDESLTDSGTAGTGGSAGKRKEREPKIVNFNFNAKMSNVLTTCKDLFFNAGFEGKLDFNRDFRAAQNGVIDLRTGGFQPHHPRVSPTNRPAISAQMISLALSPCPSPHLLRSAAVYLERSLKKALPLIVSHRFPAVPAQQVHELGLPPDGARHADGRHPPCTPEHHARGGARRPARDGTSAVPPRLRADGTYQQPGRSWRTVTYYGFIQNNSTRESHRNPNTSESMLHATSSSHVTHNAPTSTWRPTAVNRWIICNSFWGTRLERDTYYGFIQKHFY